MFVTQKMLLLDVLVLQKDIESVSQLIVESGLFEPSNYSYVSTDGEKWTHENVTDKKQMMTTLAKNVQEIKLFFTPYSNITDLSQQETLYTIPQIGDILRQYTIKKTQFEERLYRIKKQKEDVAIKIAGLRMYMNTQTKNTVPQLANSQDLYSILGLISTANLAILKNEFSRLGGELLTEGHVNDSDIVFITVPKNKQKELTNLLEQLYFVNYGLPDEFFGAGSVNMMHLGLEMTLLYDQEEMLISEIKKFTIPITSNLKNITYSLDVYSKIAIVRQSTRQAGQFVLLSGWISAKQFRTFKKSLIELCGDNFDVTVTDTDVFNLSVDIPTKLENPKIFKPFEQLVTTFGTPTYKEIDPTVLFGTFYVLMYGAMFGDVGQGAVMFLLGIIGKFMKKFESFGLIFSLMIWVGISSTIFGVLYGSYFGYESAYYAFVPEPLWISPMHNITTILLYAIYFGVFMITFSYILGIINALRMKDWATLIFSHKGLIAFVIYMLLLVIVYCVSLQIAVSTIVYILLGGLSLFLGMERVWEALIYGHGSLKDWWMGFFDMFEFFLSLLTNTLSFVRIGAFALTHAALMMAVFTLRDLAGGTTLAAYITVIIGNIFVIFVEGFIVGIQTLRLEYYEFFMRFFRGTGRVFKPITYR